MARDGLFVQSQRQIESGAFPGTRQILRTAIDGLPSGLDGCRRKPMKMKRWQASRPFLGSKAGFQAFEHPA